MPTTEHMRAVIALSEALQHVEEADTLLRPVSEFLLDQADADNLDVPEVW